jgi:hypothetical protein
MFAFLHVNSARATTGNQRGRELDLCWLPEFFVGAIRRSSTPQVEASNLATHPRGRRISLL